MNTDNLNKSKARSTDNFVLLVISGCISLGIFPFVILRVLQEDYAHAAMNAVAVFITFVLFLHAYITKKSDLTRTGLALLTVIVMTGTIFLKGAQNIHWVYPALTTTFFLLRPKFAATLTLTFLLVVLAMIWQESSPLFLLTFSITATATFLFCYAFSNRMRQQAQFLEQLATTDPLTETGNRRKLEEKLLEITQRIKRNDQLSCSLVIFDIDYFKQVNDQHGHACGDEVLKRFASVIKTRIRVTDSLYRLGGEEFVLILEDTKLFEAKSVAKQLAFEIEQTQWHLKDLRITTSAGIAEYETGESTYEWLERADEALYKAKSSGRNKCRASNENVA